METVIVEKMLRTIVKDMAYATGTIQWLWAMGYQQNFELVGNKLMCLQCLDFFYPSELTVDHLERIDGLCYIYGLRHAKSNIKGIFVIYTDEDINI